MVELLFVVCLATSPQDCHETSLVFTDITPAACLMGAQPELARWTDSHPNYRVVKWRCRHVAGTDI